MIKNHVKKKIDERHIKVEKVKKKK